MRVTHLLQERIATAKYLRAGLDGSPVYEARKDNIPARVILTSTVALSGKDEQTATTATIATEAAIGPRDRVWLPGRTTPLTPLNGGSTPGKGVRGNTCFWETTL